MVNREAGIKAERRRWRPHYFRLRGWLRLAIVLALVIGVMPPASSIAFMEEGLFTPEQISLPFDEERALKAMVRIKSRVYFAISVYDSTRQAEAARAIVHKVFLPEGITIWPVVVDKGFLERLRMDPGLRLLPMFYEIATAFEGVTVFPQQRYVPLQGAATGFFISADGYFLTTYHVMREEIEAAGRTAGSRDPITCRYVSFEIPVIERGAIVGYRPLENVQLVRHVSARESKAGLDAALLKADIESPAYLDVHLGGVQADEPIWVIGFPIRTQRDQQRRAHIGYPDADGSLRITRGKVWQQLNETNFTSTADGLSGCSGAPTLDEEGRVVGIVQNVYPKKEASRRAVVFSGGLVHVDIRAVVRRLELEAVLGDRER